MYKFTDATTKYVSIKLPGYVNSISAAPNSKQGTNNENTIKNKLKNKAIKER